MIPPPPLWPSGKLAANRWTLIGNMVPGILAPCCACRSTTAFHWKRLHWERVEGEPPLPVDVEVSYVPLHDRCADHLIQEWRAMIEHGEARTTTAAAAPMGAYARRQSARSPRPEAQPVTQRTTSTGLGSPYFIPGMPEGTPWVAVADLPDGGRLVTPCGLDSAYARQVNQHHRSSTMAGHSAGPRNLVPLGGYVCDPTGARSDEWRTDELASRDDSAKLAP